MSLAMIAVIVLSLAAAVGLGHAIIFGILHVFDSNRRSIAAAPQVLTSSAGSD
jgi:hypothetical protein